MISDTLDGILRPRSIAVIGASRRPDSIGWKILDNLLEHDYQGALYPVHPSASSVHSIRAYPTVLDVPPPVDLAVVVVPADVVVGVARQCVEAKVKGMVVITAGFREVGGRGSEREAELLEVLAGSGIRLVGPNCMGVINTEPAVSMDATFAPAMPPVGPVAFISQSGAMGVSILDHAESLGIGMSMFVSAGNKADVSGNDLLEYWQDDPNTELVLMYLENFGNPKRFVEIGRSFTKTKPIFIVKSGRTGAGARAAASHTGALAQTELATDALIAQAGAMRAQSVEELFDMAMAFANQPLPAGNRVAIVTNAGGPGIMIADACETKGLEITALDPATEDALRAKLPEEASVRNPVDLIASATAESYEHALDLVLSDPNVDAAVAAFVPPLGIQTEDVAEAIVHVNARHRDKPIMAVLMGKEGFPAGMAELHRAKIPGYIFPESAARALSAMWRYAARRDSGPGAFVSFDVQDDDVRNIIDATLQRGHAKLSEPDAMRVLEAYDIPTVPWAFVEATEKLAERAAQAADSIGYPVAMKIVSPDITHKTDVGGVALDLAGPDEVREAAAEMVRQLQDLRIENRRPSVDGLLIQAMAREGRETIVGMTRIPRVGPMVMFGLGGIYVEIMRDVVLRLCPLQDQDAEQMIREVKMYQLLEGVRGEPHRDLDALADVLLRVSQLAERHPRIAEMDINPLLSLEVGATAVDARIQLEADA